MEITLSKNSKNKKKDEEFFLVKEMILHQLKLNKKYDIYEKINRIN